MERRTPINHTKYSANARYNHGQPKTIRDIYNRGCQLMRLGYDPRGTLPPQDSARCIHWTNARIADLAFQSMRDAGHELDASYTR